MQKRNTVRFRFSFFFFLFFCSTLDFHQELELLASKLNPTNVINQSLINDIKQTQDIRFENEQLKKEIELLK